VLWEQFGLYYGGLIPACQRLSNFEYNTRIAPQHFLLQGDQEAASYIAAATGSWTASWWLSEKTSAVPTPVQ